MLFVYITVIISFLLDGVLSNFLNYMLGDISIFNPLLTIVTIIMIYPYFKKDENKRYDRGRLYYTSDDGSKKYNVAVYCKLENGRLFDVITNRE